MTPGETDRIRNEYSDSAVHFYEFILSILGHRLPFNVFEMEVVKNLIVDPLKLHPASWACVKVFSIGAIHDLKPLSDPFLSSLQSSLYP